jgi:hypothetical protein
MSNSISPSVFAVFVFFLRFLGIFLFLFAKSPSFQQNEEASHQQSRLLVMKNIVLKIEFSEY